MAENKIVPGMNDGYIEDVIKESDFFAGGVSGITYEELNPTSDWTPYLPSEERQRFRNFDSMGCVSFSALNVFETQMNFLLATGKIPKFLVKWLGDEGYLDENGKVNFSDRYLAKMSGTTLQGNSLQKICDTLRHFGCVPEKNWLPSEEYSRSEYFAEIPQWLIEKGKKFLEYFDIQYEWVRATGANGAISYTSVEKELKHAPLQIATPVCSPWGNGIIPACGDRPSHASTIMNLEPTFIHDFDTYDPFLKKLARNYPIPYIMKVLIKPKTKEITTEMVRQAWLNDPNVKKEYPAETKFYSINNPNYSIYDWARDWGVYDHAQCFTSGFRATEEVLQVEGTDFYILNGPGGGLIDSPSILDGKDYQIKTIEPHEARKIVPDFENATPIELKKKFKITAFADFFRMIWKNIFK